MVWQIRDLTRIFHVCHLPDIPRPDYDVMAYVHRLPGRLRVRSEALKRNPTRGSEILTAIGMLPGVNDVDVNIVTGSVLVQFDPLRVSADAVFEELGRHGVAIELDRPDLKPATRPEDPSVGGAVAKAIAAAVIQHALERSVAQIIPMLL